jgi:FMN phosphatase YigB (HAD superfamily)
MKTILVDAVHTFVVKSGDSYRIFQEMYAMLEVFPNRKILLTVANDEELIEFSLTKMPYEVFTLKHNPNKTDPKYYAIMLQHFNLTKDDVVYFEHNPDAIKSAESVGIKSYYYDSNKRDLNALKGFLIKNL